MEQNYYIGLDIGTNSVGWAVTDEKYNLVKAPVKGRYKNHDMWGIRLFESANTAAERRVARSNRRRGQRKVRRIKLLQELFAEEMNKVDPTFFIRLNESRLHPEDKSEILQEERHLLFIGNEEAEKEYYEKYPTIYHLRKDLIDDAEPHDIRLVYLALHHIIKNRGHFLREGSFSDAVDFDVPFGYMIGTFDNMGIQLKYNDKNVVKSILSDRALNNSDKQKKLMEQFELNLSQDATAELDSAAKAKKEKVMLTEITRLMVGNKGTLSKIFEDIPDDVDGTKTDVKLSEEKYETEIRNLLMVQYPDEINAVDCIKTVYDWSILQEILPGNSKYISDAKVNAYEHHKKNLQILKENVFGKYFTSKEYNDFFRNDVTANYVHYVGVMNVHGKKLSVKKCSEDEFYSHLKKLLDSVKHKAENNDDALFEEIYHQVENHTLLPLQRSKDNGVIPHQVHEFELNKILENASQYLPFLNDIDETATSLKDKTVKGKILSIFKFRIPYYVGPLSSKHQSENKERQVGSNSWMVRKPGMENIYIYPWNFDDVVDKEKCNELFIGRMTNKCTYLVGEDVLPKNSLLYKKFTVLNELNNLKVYGKEVTVELKQSIFNDLFKKKAKVTGKALLLYLQKMMTDPALKIEDLSGFDQDFANNLSSYLDFRKKVFADQELTYEQEQSVETIIKWITIYGDDSSMIEKMIRQNYGDMYSKEQIAAMKRLRYSGWGNFSKKFLTDISGMVGDEYGTAWSIMEGLWGTNENLMQLLSNKYMFTDAIDRINSQFDMDVNQITYENIIEDLYVSPENKRAIWQTIQIVEEIQKIMKHPAKKIFVEMARGGEKEKKRTVSRKEKLIELYKKQSDNDVREWGLAQIEGSDEREFNSIKLYLYFLQQGKCAYTGNPINLADLMAGNTRWDRDHIYPQSKIKDDSLDNLVLVERQKNAKKNNGLVSQDVQNKMEGTWCMWYKEGFITKEKYDRLTRREDFNDDELSGFIARQLVETRQTTKVVADVMKQIYSENDTKIVYVKASLASDFRKYPLNVLKSRRVNDYHHAKDAYLNIVVGDVYNIKYTDNPWKWMKENRDKVDSGQISFHKTMCFDVTDKNGNLIWEGCNKIKSEDGKSHFEIKDDSDIPGNKIIVGGDIDRIRSIVRKNTCMYTEYTYCDSGELFNASHERKGSKSATLQLKGNLPIERYGGYKSANTSYFAIVEFDGKKGKRVKNMIGVPIYVANMLEYDFNAFLEYCKERGMENVTIICPKIKKNALVIVNGFPMRVRGETEKQMSLKNNVQLKTDIVIEEQIRKIEKAIEKNNDVFDELHDGLTDDMLIDVYDFLERKLELGMYKNRPANQCKKLQMGRDIFVNLSLRNKCVLISEVLTFVRCDVKTNANLELIGGGTNNGNIAINKNTFCMNPVTTVNQSITGLYESREKY